MYGDVKTLSEDNWNATWNELEKYDANNKEILYTIKEVAIDFSNETITPVEDNEINGDYRVTYAIDGEKTIITNTFRKPEITVTKSQNKEQNSNTSEGNTEKTEEQKEVDEKTEDLKEINETTEVETPSAETTTEVNESEIDN